MSEYGVALFFTTSSVMGAEKSLIKRGFSVKLIPTPRQFSSDCGIALRFPWQRHMDILAIFESERIEYEAIRQL